MAHGTRAWALITRTDTVIETEPRKYRFLAEIEAWRRNLANPDTVTTVERLAVSER